MVSQTLNCSGRFDLVVYSDEVALCIDYKTGYSEPEPAELNAQLKVLAVLVALELLKEGIQLKEVVCMLVSRHFGVTETRFSIKQLEAVYDELIETLRAINAEYASFNPSPEACRYCPAIMICQATKDLVLPLARLQHSALPQGERAGKLLDECELLERHIGQIRAYYAEQLTSDPSCQIPGWSMQPGPQRRELTNALAARHRLEEFVPAAELDALANYSIPALEKLLGKSLGLKARETGAKLAQVLGELLHVKPGNPVLKRTKGEAKVLALG